MAKAFPSPLDEKVSLRNIPKVAKLSPQQQKILAQAVRAGLKRIPTALDYLEANPDATDQKLLEIASRSDNHPGKTQIDDMAKPQRKQEPPRAMTIPDTPVQSQELPPPGPDALKELVGLLKTCYPDMNPHSAEALAESQALRDILSVLLVYQQVFDSPHFKTDFVVVLFHKLLEQTWERLNQRIVANPAYQQALRLSAGQAFRQDGVEHPAPQRAI